MGFRRYENKRCPSHIGSSGVHDHKLLGAAPRRHLARVKACIDRQRLHSRKKILPECEMIRMDQINEAFKRMEAPTCVIDL